MAKTPDEIVAEIDRKQNEEDLDLPARAGRMLKEKLDEDLTGGAYVGSRLNMPSNTSLGKLSPSDTRLYNDTKAQNARDKMVDAYTGKAQSKTESRYGMKKGGKVKVSSASKRADGIAQKGKTKGKYL